MQFLDGNETAVLGALRAGCTFFAGYPITPATSIFTRITELLPRRGGTALVAEDEIAALGMCIGASMSGRKVMTATSGPGFALMLEGLGLAVMAQVPLVVVVVQRQGPSTGSATKEAAGDVMTARWGLSGGLPLVTLCPDSIESCYRLTGEAFNIAERYRTPVVLLTSKELAMTRFRCDLESASFPSPEDRKVFEGPGPFRPYAVEGPTDIPDFLPVGHPEHLVRFTTSTHDAEGRITDLWGAIGDMVEQLEKKIPAGAADLTFSETDGDDGAPTLVLSYGMTSRAARVAVARARGKGARVRHLVLQTLWPAPEDLIREASDGAERVVVPEQNLGQYATEVERILKDHPARVECVCRMDTKLLTPDEIFDAISERGPEGRRP
jgi:2-oxoglutarate ferredoxin oxidoreductase subunit alpha